MICSCLTQTHLPLSCMFCVLLLLLVHHHQPQQQQQPQSPRDKVSSPRGRSRSPRPPSPCKPSTRNPYGTAQHSASTLIVVLCFSLTLLPHIVRSASFTDNVPSQLMHLHSPPLLFLPFLLLCRSGGVHTVTQDFSARQQHKHEHGSDQSTSPLLADWPTPTPALETLLGSHRARKP